MSAKLVSPCTVKIIGEDLLGSDDKQEDRVNISSRVTNMMKYRPR